MESSKLTKNFLTKPIDLTNSNLTNTYTRILTACHNLNPSLLEFLLENRVSASFKNGKWSLTKLSTTSDTLSVSSSSSGYSSHNANFASSTNSTPSSTGKSNAGQKRPRKLIHSPLRKKSKPESKVKDHESSDDEIVWSSYENPNIAIGPDGNSMENFPVKLINSIDNDKDPLKSEVFRFQYINDSHCHMRRKDADVIKQTIKKYYDSKLKKNELVPCECDSESKCIRNCSCKTFYKLQKASNGECKLLLKRSKIHDRDKLIIECTQSCDCPTNCVNQVVGSCCGKINIECSVRKTDKTGYGLFAERDIEEGEFLGCYLGEMVIHDPKNPGYVVDDAYYFEYWPEINQYLPNPSTSLYVDARKYGNATRFVNHSCQPNLEGFHVITNFSKHNLSDSQLPSIAFFAKKFIPKGSQLLTDYTSSYWNVMNGQGVFCNCDAKICHYSHKKYNRTKR